MRPEEQSIIKNRKIVILDSNTITSDLIAPLPLFQNLTNIAMLRYHRYLQYIDLAYNNISCLSPLSSLPYLMYLNASHNKIKHSLKFTPPWYLTYVNLSYNHMSDIGDLRNCWSIVRLNLSHNVIETISGLENLKRVSISILPQVCLNILDLHLHIFATYFTFILDTCST